MERLTLFVDVILPVPIPRLYTYRVPFELNDSMLVGQRVVVQFGKSKLYTAIVRKIHETPPVAYQAKYIESLLDDQPLVHESQFEFWDWIARYYMCTIGEVMNAALPGSLRLASETTIVLNPMFDRNYTGLTDREFLISEALEIRKKLTLKEVSEILDIKTVYPVVKALIEKHVVVVEEELKERYKPRMKAFVKLTEEADDETTLEHIFSELEKRAPKQVEVLLKYVQMSDRYGEKKPAIGKLELQKAADVNSSVVGQLVKKNIFELFDQEVGRIASYDGKKEEFKSLNDEQETALEHIREAFVEQDVALLYGVTGSGKTEVYVQLMEAELAKGKQVLYLLPEIALTTQIITRLRKYFGDRIGVYHSRFNQNERVEIWNSVLHHQKGKHDIILGARSALLLPFNNLGLVIVDEEHESTFKQYEPAPRYHARDAAVVLARQAGGKVLLGSATPSIESFWNSRQEKYGYAELNKRHSGVKLPEVLCADIGKAMKRKEMKSLFTTFLLEHMRAALEAEEQIILFQNRRGYAPQWSCNTCGWTPFCTNCDVRLTYHKYAHQLRCHYCGFNIPPQARCEACGSSDLKMLGFGTEKIEEELSLFLPDARIARMDLDTTRGKHAYQRIISDFEDGLIDVLVGTQMVTKGLDFDNVGLVGVLNADMMLNFPDFRAFERAYQLMAQVSGRAGRKEKRGKVIIQTYNPNHWIIQQVIKNDYMAMYQQEILERRNYNYPPFCRLTAITLKHKERSRVKTGGEVLAARLRKVFRDRVLGPEFPYISRIRNLYQIGIMLKVERNANTTKVKELLQKELDAFHQEKDFKSIRIVIDVDPV